MQNNLQARALLLQTGIRQRKNLGVTTGALGQTSRIKLFNVGILTSIRLYVTCPITIGVAVATLSQRGPWNLISRVRVTDYDGTDRVNVSGLQMYIMDSVRNGEAYGWNNNQAAVAGAGIVSNPSAPTAVGNGTISFYLDVPLALNDNRRDGLMQDLTGAIYAQTGVGELYLSIDWNNLLYGNANIEAVYSGAGTTTVALNGVAGPSVQVWQNYIMPQPVNNQGQLPIPGIDLTSVYELNGNLRSTDNLAANTEKLMSYPNVRRVLGAYFNFINNGAMSATDVTGFRLIVNGNNILEEYTQIAQQLEQRIALSGDLGAGIYFWQYRDHPVETAIFGNVQLGITPNAVAGNSYVEIAYESTYTKGTALPGLQQAQ